MNVAMSERYLDVYVYIYIEMAFERLTIDWFFDTLIIHLLWQWTSIASIKTYEGCGSLTYSGRGRPCSESFPHGIYEKKACT